MKTGNNYSGTRWAFSQRRNRTPEPAPAPAYAVKVRAEGVKGWQYVTFDTDGYTIAATIAEATRFATLEEATTTANIIGSFELGVLDAKAVTL